MEKNEKILTLEEKERQERLRFRIFVLLIVLDLFLLGYLVFEIVMLFTAK